MKIDQYGLRVYDCDDIVDIILTDPTKNINGLLVQDLNFEFDEILENLPNLIRYTDPGVSVEAYDRQNQKSWFMPEEYKNLDIAQWVLSQCQTQEQLQRCGEELLLFQEKNLFDLLRYLKFLVDTMRQHQIIWGVGRGSSVASYVLYLLGVHRIDSMYYDLDIREFLR